MSKPGYVYLLKSDTKPVRWKIGKTVDPKSRVKTFGVELPFDVTYEHIIQCYDMDKMERDLHGSFALQRISGEWFDLPPRHIRWIKQFAHQIDFDWHCKSFGELKDHKRPYPHSTAYYVGFALFYIIMVAAFILTFAVLAFSNHVSSENYWLLVASVILNVISGTAVFGIFHVVVIEPLAKPNQPISRS